MDIASLILNYGYAVIFFGTLLEGETWVALGGFAVYQGYLNFPLLVVISIIGAVIGDQAFFYFGRYKGAGYVEKRPALKLRVEKIRPMIERNQNWLMLSSRFMYGFRAVLPIALGMSKVNARKFLLINAIGAIIWASLFASLGYAFGGAIEAMLGNIKKMEEYVLLTIVAVILITQLYFWYRRKSST